MPTKQNLGNSKTQPTTTRTLAKPGPDASEQQEQQAAAPARGGKNRADLFNAAPKEEGFNFPVGQYLGFLVGAKHVIDGEKESIEFTYEVSEGDQAGKQTKAWYNLFDERGEPQRGAGFFKKDLELLEREPIPYEELEDGLRVLEDERLAIIFDVKKGKTGYTNVYLKGLQ